MDWIKRNFKKAVLTPVKALKKRYIPLLLIYFAYGASSFAGVALTFWQKEHLSLSADQLLMISVWVMTPWTIKMVFGQFVDGVKLFGNRRQSYIYLGAGFVALQAIILAGMAGGYDWITWLGGEYHLYLIALLCGAFGFMIQDVTADTMSTEVVERYELKKGKSVKRNLEDVQHDLAMVQVLGRLSLLLAIVAVAWLGGWLAGQFSFEQVAWMMLVIPLISILGALFIKLEDHAEEQSKLDPKILGGGIAFGVFSVVMALTNVPYAQEIVVGVSLILLLSMLYWITKDAPKAQLKKIWLALLVIFVYRATPGVGPGYSWWAIDVLEFDQEFFGVLRQVGSILALLVLWFLADFIAKKSIRSVFLFLVLFGGFLILPDLMLYYGVHEQLGLPAKAVALIDSSLDNPLAHISMIPMLSLIAFYAPPTHRGTWFAVAASLMNLATTAGSLFTRYLNQVFVVTRDVLNEAGEIIVAADYSQLGYLLITAAVISISVPLVTILLCLKRKLK